MSTFSQWYTKFQKEPFAKQVTWICGDQAILMEEILDSLRTYLGSHEWETTTYFAGVDPERTVWNDIFQRSLGDSKRLIIVRNASNLSRLDKIKDFYETRAKVKDVYVVFLDYGKDVPRRKATEEEVRQHKRPPYEEYIGLIASRGTLVECKQFTQATVSTAVAWVLNKVHLREGVARHLLQCANGDLKKVRDACFLLQNLPGEVTVRTVSALFEGTPQDDFVSALMLRDKATALAALKRLDVTEYPGMISALDSHLEIAERIYELLVSHHSPAEIQAQLRAKRDLVPELLPVAKHYSPKKVLAIRNALAEVDRVQQARYYEGTMEALVTMW